MNKKYIIYRKMILLESAMILKKQNITMNSIPRQLGLHIQYIIIKNNK